jgi:hemerythrin-like domain-containing protein
MVLEVFIMHPTLVLMNEHRIIEQVLTALENEVSELDRKPLRREFFDQALDFFSTFADGCHHMKEEQRLFPLLKERGIPEDGGPIGVMLHEHAEGRALLTAIRANLDAAGIGAPAAISAVRANAISYIQLLRQHIYKEDNILFRMAQTVLTPSDVACVEHHHVGAGVHERYEALAQELTGAALPQAG